MPTPPISHYKWRRYKFVPTDMFIPTNSSTCLKIYTDYQFIGTIWIDQHKKSKSTYSSHR